MFPMAFTTQSRQSTDSEKEQLPAYLFAEGKKRKESTKAHSPPLDFQRINLSPSPTTFISTATQTKPLLRPILKSTSASNQSFSSFKSGSTPSLISSPSSSLSSRPTSPLSLDHSIRLPPPPPQESPSKPHPYARIKDMSPLLVQDESDDETCPVCCESLTMRLAGEKPHIVPVCGHKLHEACFEAVYGPVSRARTRPTASLGVCGVCRRDMKVGEAGEHGKNKFATMMGLPGARNSPPLDSHKVRSISKRTIPSEGTGGRATHDPNEDDDLLFRQGQAAPMPAIPMQYAYGHAHHSSGDTIAAADKAPLWASQYGQAPSSSSIYSPPSDHTPSPRVVCQPKITVRAEHATIVRQSERSKTSNITCMVTIEMPSRMPQLQQSKLNDISRNNTIKSNTSHILKSASNGSNDDSLGFSYSATSSISDPLSPSHYNGESDMQEAFEGIVTDLNNRMADWKGHTPQEFGKLHMYDLLSVRKQSKIREFYIYLFSDALLCIAEDRSKDGAGKLRLKGRVYIKHVARVVDSSDAAENDISTEHSLTITMDDDSLELFVIIFKSAGQLQTWKTRIEALVKAHQLPAAKRTGSSARDSTYSGETALSQSAQSNASTLLSKMSRSTGLTTASYGKEMSPLPEETASMIGNGYYDPAAQDMADSASVLRSPFSPTAPALNLPHDFPSIDLMLIFAVPLPSNAPSSYYLKIKLIKSTLEFVLNNVGPRARISLITYSSGENGKGALRKTPLLAVGKEQGRQRLLQFIGDIGSEAQSEHDSNSVDRDERTNVVTAVNLALDIILQRKAKSALTGMLLMNDGRDGAHRQQMDLVMARAEAASVPIHTFGWSRSHDPQSLWLLSSHTGGTYTFIRELYSLRETIAGCVGGILSISASIVKLFISVPEKRWFKIRKVSGVNGALISAEGHEVDISLGELRSGERREMLIEVEMVSFAGSMRQQNVNVQGVSTSPMTATDDFLRKNGLSPLTLEDCANELSAEDLDRSAIDEVPLFEVNASYKDPLAGKLVSRLPYPVLLLTTIAPPPIEGSLPLNQPSDYSIVRRRVELLCADMQTRCILLVSRRNPHQAARLLTETHRIVGTIVSNLPASDPHDAVRSSDHKLAVETVADCLADIAYMLEGVEQKDQFESTHRNYAAQSAVVLRDQRAWVGKTGTERRFWNSDFSLWMASKSAELS